jgi:hypothetical protein
LTGLPGQFYFLKKSKRRHFSKKKPKVNRLQPDFLLDLAGSTHRVTLGFSFPYFFFNPALFQPRVPGRPAGPSFKTMDVKVPCKIAEVLQSYVIVGVGSV